MRLTLFDKTPETHATVSFFFRSDRPVTWQAGQFLHYILDHPHPDERGIERWFTIASAPHEGHVRLTTRFAGESSSFKRALQDLPIGGTVEADGPEGEFVVEDPSAEHVFIAGGIGVTPYRAMLLDLDHRTLPVHASLLYANRTDEFVYRKELEAVRSRHPSFRIHYFVSPKQIDETAIRERVTDLTGAIFYVSGPEPMVVAFEKLLGAMGIPDARLKRDYFPGYAWP